MSHSTPDPTGVRGNTPSGHELGCPYDIDMDGWHYINPQPPCSCERPSLSAEFLLSMRASGTISQPSIVMLCDEIDRLRWALTWYADESNWVSRRLSVVPPGQPNEGASTWESGPAVDGGRRARSALEGGHLGRPSSDGAI